MEVGLTIAVDAPVSPVLVLIVLIGGSELGLLAFENSLANAMIIVIKYRGLERRHHPPLILVDIFEVIARIIE